MSWHVTRRVWEGDLEGYRTKGSYSVSNPNPPPPPPLFFLVVTLGMVPPAAMLPVLPPFSASATAAAGSAAVSASAAIAQADGSAGMGAQSQVCWAAAAPLMSLLFPQAGAASAKMPKVWVGDGLPAIPKKLHTRMLNWEFVDLTELRPVGTLEKLNPEPDPHRYIIMPGLEVARASKKPIEDIQTWIQCFLIYVAVMATKYPSVIPGMVAYMLVIIKAQQEYEEPAWRLYDEAFREKAATTGNRKWALSDPHLYSQLFTGRARKVPLCAHCGAATHKGEACPKMGQPPSKKVACALQVGAGPSQALAGNFKAGRPAKAGGVTGASGACWAFNEGYCTYGAQCKYRHLCSKCTGRHPATRCPKGAPAQK